MAIKQADTAADGLFQGQGDSVYDSLTGVGGGEDDKQHAGNKHGCQTSLPAIAELSADGVGKEGVEAHAGCLCQGVVGEQADEYGADGGRDTGGQHDCAGVHAGVTQDRGVDEDDVRHGEEGSQAGHDLGAHIGVIPLQVEEIALGMNHGFDFVCHKKYPSFPAPHWALFQSGPPSFSGKTNIPVKNPSSLGVLAGFPVFSIRGRTKFGNM